MAWVHDRIFAAGGSHIPSTWESFQRQMGVTAVLTLAESWPAQFLCQPPERFLWLDVLDEKEADLPARLLAGRFLHDCIDRGDRVLLHSSQGRHRTRWAFVAFLLYNGKSVSASLRQAAERPWLHPYETDREMWRELDQIIESSLLGPAV